MNDFGVDFEVNMRKLERSTTLSTAATVLGLVGIALPFVCLPLGIVCDVIALLLLVASHVVSRGVK
jgi:hypothetical protein